MTTKKEERRVARWIALVARVVALAAFLLAPLNVFSDEIGGKRYAVLIGINDYDDYPEISLNFCASDVEALADTLQRAGYDEIIILDSNAQDATHKPTRENIVATIREVCTKAKEGDLVFVAYSGHGVNLPATNASYILPCDLNLAKIAETAVAVEDVYETIGACDAEHKLFVVDACRNTPDLQKSVGALDFGSTRDIPTALDFNPNANREPSLSASNASNVTLLQSCSQGETSLENPQLQHGVFTYYLVEALEGKADFNRNGAVTVLEANMYVDEETKNFFKQRLQRVGQTVRFTAVQTSNFDLVQVGLPPDDLVGDPPRPMRNKINKPTPSTEEWLIPVVENETKISNSWEITEVELEPEVETSPAPRSEKPVDEPRFPKGVAYDLSKDQDRALWTHWDGKRKIVEGFEPCDDEFIVSFALNLNGGACDVVLEDDDMNRVVVKINSDGGIEITQGAQEGGDSRGGSNGSFTVTRVYNNRGQSKFMASNNSTGANSFKSVKGFGAIARVEFEFSNSSGSVMSLVISGN